MRNLFTGRRLARVGFAFLATLAWSACTPVQAQTPQAWVGQVVATYSSDGRTAYEHQVNLSTTTLDVIAAGPLPTSTGRLPAKWSATFHRSLDYFYGICGGNHQERVNGSGSGEGANLIVQYASNQAGAGYFIKIETTGLTFDVYEERQHRYDTDCKWERTAYTRSQWLTEGTAFVPSSADNRWVITGTFSQSGFTPGCSLGLCQDFTFAVRMRRANCTGAPDDDGDGLNICEEFDLGTDPSKVDTDGDGIPDGEELPPRPPTVEEEQQREEREVVHRYAPLVFLHDNETAFPMDPGTFLAYSQLRWSYNDCGDALVVDTGSIDEGRLVDTGYAAQKSDACNIDWPNPIPKPLLSGPYFNTSSDLTAPAQAANPKHAPSRNSASPLREGFYLDVDDDVRNGLHPLGAAYHGARYTNGPALYYEYSKGRYIIYWFFYGNNDRQFDKHEGDWEKIVVKLSTGNELTRVAYYQHYCEPTDPETTYGERTRFQLESRGLLYGTHPIVYSARAGHASFPGRLDSPEPGDVDVQPCGSLGDGAFDRLTENGWMWFTWEGARREPLRNAARQRWYGFGGGWGGRQGNANLPNAGWGPLGPGDVMWEAAPPLPRTWVSEWLADDSLTRVGSAVQVTPQELRTGGHPVSVTFANVESAGATSVTVRRSGPALPTGFALLGSSASFDVSTSARFSGTVTLCFPIDGVANLSDVRAARVFHLEGDTMVDRTILPPEPLATDPATGTICARVSSLSPFAIGAPDTDGDGLPDLWERQFGLTTASATGRDGAAGDPDGDGIGNLGELRAGSNPTSGDPWGAASGRAHLRFLGEGATSAFFSTRLALLNPSSLPASTTLWFQKGDGSVVAHDEVIPPFTRRTVDAGTVPGLSNAEFATVVQSDVLIVADRTMTWDRSGYGSHAETSLASPSDTWYLAEGATHSGFELFYLIQNPSSSEVTVKVEYLLPAPAPPIVKMYKVAAHARFNIWVDEDDPRLRSTDVSARITANGPIIVERAMYLSKGQVFTAGHNSTGITAPATRWFFAEGATGEYFDLFLLIANPSTTTAEVRATYLLPSGQTLTRTYAIAPQSRFNIWVDLEDVRLANTAVSTILESTNDVPVVAERSMWWPANAPLGWHEAHNSAGATETGTQWALAEGEVGGEKGQETYVLVANTSTWTATARATLFFEDGSTATRTFTVPASSRFNIAVAAEFPEAAGRRFGTLVESIGPAPALIVVERAMYSDANGVRWAAGTNALATLLR